MKIFTSIAQELRTPDDQGKDWYGWASNQLSHALFGVIIALHLPGGAIEVALIVALLKECFDLVQNFTRRAVVDSLVDATFWVIGAWLIVAEDKTLATIILAFALICGVIPRVRKSLR